MPPTHTKSPPTDTNIKTNVLEKYKIDHECGYIPMITDDSWTPMEILGGYMIFRGEKIDLKSPTKTKTSVHWWRPLCSSCFAVLCCGYTLTDFPISIRLTSLALWQSNDCPSASKATLMNMDKYFMWIHYERLHNHNKAKHNKTVCIFLGLYCNAARKIYQGGPRYLRLAEIQS